MFLKLGILCIALFASQISTSLANSQQISPDDLTYQASALASPNIGEGYIHTPGVGTHKFHTQAKLWDQANQICREEGGHFAIVNSLREEEVMRNMFRNQLHNIRGAKTTDEAFIGVHDLYQEGDWRTVLGCLSQAGFINWGTECYGPQPSYGQNQRCGALTHKCPGMDNTWCTMPLAFFCELFY